MSGSSEKNQNNNLKAIIAFANFIGSDVSFYDIHSREQILKGYNVKVAHPLMVKAVPYAKVKTDKVDARILADLLRTDMIPECYNPDEKIRNQSQENQQKFKNEK